MKLDGVGDSVVDVKDVGVGCNVNADGVGLYVIIIILILMLIIIKIINFNFIKRYIIYNYLNVVLVNDVGVGDTAINYNYY